MNILIVGAGKGSFQMRAVQLGAALGARVTSSPTDEDFAWCDLAVLVKKHATTFAPRAHKAGKPIVWDALDFWSQPAHNGYKADAATLTLQTHIKMIKPALVIGATEAMAAAARAFCPAEYLPHHSWAGLAPTAIRDQVAVVAYEGNPIYLGRWHGWLTEACEKRGWRFVVNPTSLADADLIVSFRDGHWDGWICREWKSGVKIVNAIAAGRPLLHQPSAAARELRPFGQIVEEPKDLDGRLDVIATYEFREQALQKGAALHASVVAARYLDILSTMGASCTA